MPKVNSVFRPYLVIVAVALVVHGIFIPLLGLYWDDLLFFWVGQTQGAAGLYADLLTDRPGSGVLFALTHTLFDDNLILWHTFLLVIRLSGGLALCWIWQAIFPRLRAQALLIGVLFVIYPGFLGQSLTIAFQNYQLSLLFGILSIALTVKAHRAISARARWLWIIGALMLGFASWFILEVMFVLEIFRFFVLGLLGDEPSRRKRFLAAVRQYVPYFFVLAAFWFWRLFLFDASRPGTDVGEIAGIHLQSLEYGLFIFIVAAVDFFQAIVVAWFAPFLQFFQVQPTDTLLITGVCLLIGIVTGVIVVLRLRGRETDDISDALTQKPLIPALALITFLSLIPAVFTFRDITLEDYNYRYTLPVIVPVVTLVSSIIFLLPRTSVRVGFAALLICLAAAANIQAGIQYREQWERWRETWWQILWRVPGFEPETLILLDVDDPYHRVSYWAIWAMGNTLYAPTSSTPQFYARELDSDGMGLLQRNQASSLTLRTVNYFEDPQKGLLIIAPSNGSCLWVIDRDRAVLPASASPNAALAMPFSDINRVQVDSQPPVPISILGDEPAHDWCYAFQRAELARQSSDWAAIVDIAQQAEQQNWQPNDPLEWLPFIEAYASLGMADPIERILMSLEGQTADTLQTLTCQYAADTALEVSGCN